MADLTEKIFPKTVESVALNCCSRIFTQEEMSETLDPNIKLVFRATCNGEKKDERTIVGREEVISEAQKVANVIQATENFEFSIRGDEASDNPPSSIAFVQRVLLKENDAFPIQIIAKGEQKYTWGQVKLANGGKKKVVKTIEIVVETYLANYPRPQKSRHSPGKTTFQKH